MKSLLKIKDPKLLAVAEAAYLANYDVHVFDADDNTSDFNIMGEDTLIIVGRKGERYGEGETV